MKKGKLIIVAVTVLAIGYLGFSSFNKIQKNRQISDAIQSLPAFSFALQNGGTFTQENLDQKAGKLIFNFFNPECEHCQYMASQFVSNKEKLAGDQLLFVTTADSLAVDKFSKTYQLNTISNLVLLRDTHYQFTSTFGARIIPSFFVYDADGKLLRKFAGETKIENLLK